MYQPKLPAEPVDGFKITFFTTAEEPNEPLDACVREGSMTYNAATDGWVADNGVLTWRGWQLDVTRSFWKYSAFETKQAALEAQVTYRRERLAVLKVQMEKHQQILTRALDHLYAIDPDPISGRH